MNPSIKIYSHKNKKEYEHLLASHNLNLDIYYQTDFLEIDAKMQGGEYEIFCVEENENIFIYPYIKLSFKDPAFNTYFDIISPYGYCGPFCNNQEFMEIAELKFLAHSETNFISEFVRYHYLYNSKNVFTHKINNIPNRIIALLDIDTDWENIWMNAMSTTNRNIVRKLEKEGYVFEIHFNTEFLDEFISMYNANMKRLNSKKFYYFASEFYYNLFEKFGKNIFLGRIVKDNDTYCSALFFISGDILTYYLSARNLEKGNTPASNLMLTNAIKYAHSKGLKLVNLGGGRTNSSTDLLLKFKKQFTKKQIPFIIGKRIHNNKKYQELIAKFISEFGSEKYDERKDVLQFYRT